MATALLARGLRLLDTLGRGGHSIVYRGRDDRLARDVAVKVIDSTRATSAALARFQHEVSVVARLRHPHILPLYDAGIAEDGSAFAVMPLATGQTLREYARGRPLPLRTVLALAREIADALSYAHEQGLIHRDIKPENILIEHDHAVVADFGLAIQGVDRVSELKSTQWLNVVTDERLTAAGAFVGTPLYASPEQVSGSPDVDARADIFSLGVVCYELLTGMPPFQGDTVQETIAARFGGPPRPMNERGVRVPARVEAVILKALSRAADDRHRTVREFRDELTTAARASFSPFTRRRVVAAGLLTLAAGVALGIAVQVARRRESELRNLDPARVVVADLDNETADSAYARWGDAVGDIIATRLAQVPGLHVVTSQRWLERSQKPHRLSNARASLRNMAAETNAATVVSGGYYRDDGRLALILEVTDARSGDIVRTVGPVLVSPTSPDSAVITLGERLGASLDTLLVQRTPPK